MNRYFITGTDTDCGKTYVTCQLLNYFQKQGRRCLALKPVASGCLEMNGELVSLDAQALQHHQPWNSQVINPWCFKSPISPHLAAAEEGRSLSAGAISAFCHDSAFAEVDELLIEGAGGLMAPLNQEETWLDFLRISQIPVILVVGMRLGCLNHALLSALALKSEAVQCIGWVANCLDNDMQALSANIKTLSYKLTCPLLATVPYAGALIAEVSGVSPFCKGR